ncbi:unnamed protein product [Xylocopa violacea]|uniref:Uncharacterized protein n=1 Tax=Xylocopa violacea TaxID=135666 RepID=A0ABP1N5J9_XYLVO
MHRVLSELFVVGKLVADAVYPRAWSSLNSCPVEGGRRRGWPGRNVGPRAFLAGCECQRVFRVVKRELVTGSVRSTWWLTVGCLRSDRLELDREHGSSEVQPRLNWTRLIPGSCRASRRWCLRFFSFLTDQWCEVSVRRVREFERPVSRLQLSPVSSTFESAKRLVVQSCEVSCSIAVLTRFRYHVCAARRRGGAFFKFEQ